MDNAPQGVFRVDTGKMHPDTPADVKAAVDLLQAHGYTVLPEPLSAVTTRCSVALDDDQGSQDGYAARVIRRTLFPAIGEALASCASLSVEMSATKRDITATLYVARPANSSGMLSAVLNGA